MDSSRSMRSCSKFYRSESGYSLPEFIFVTALIAILSAVGVSNYKVLDDPLQNATAEVNHFLRLVRGQAMAKTQVIQIFPSDDGRIAAMSSDSCLGDMEAVSDLFLDIPDGTSFSELDWSVCFTQRGFAEEYVIFEIVDRSGRSQVIEVSLAGGTRVQ